MGGQQHTPENGPRFGIPSPKPLYLFFAVLGSAGVVRFCPISFVVGGGELEKAGAGSWEFGSWTGLKVVGLLSGHGCFACAGAGMDGLPVDGEAAAAEAAAQRRRKHAVASMVISAKVREKRAARS